MPAILCLQDRVLPVPADRHWVAPGLEWTYEELQVEWPEIDEFWSRLEAHVSQHWRIAEGPHQDETVLARAFNDGVAALQRVGAPQTELRLGLFMCEVLVTASSCLAGHAAYAGGSSWTAGSEESFSQWLAILGDVDVTVVRSPVARQHRGALAQSFFFRFLEPRVRGIVWRFVEPAMGGPPIHY